MFDRDYVELTTEVLGKWRNGDNKLVRACLSRQEIVTPSNCA